MPSRDVELIIRAKNEASKAIDAVNEALKKLIAIQGDTTKSAEQTNTILGELGRELETLKAKASGLEAFGTIVKQLDLAGAAAQRVSNDLDRTIADLAKLKDAAAAAADQTANLVAQAKAASQAYAAQRESVASAKSALSAINAEVRRAESAYASLGKQVAALTAPNAELIAQYDAQKAALDTLKTRQRELSASLDSERAALKSTTQAHKELQTAVSASAQAQQKLEAAASKTAISVERQSVSVTEANAALSEVQGIATQASTALGGLAADEKAVSAASIRAAADLKAVAQAMEAQRTLRSPASVDQGPAAAATAAYRAQAEAVAAARDQLAALSAVTTQLGRVMAEATIPSETLQRQFLLARAASEAAKTAYVAQAIALNELKGAAQGGFASFVAAEAGIKTFTVAEEQATTISGAFRRALAELASGFNSTSEAATKAGGGVGVFRQALAGSSSETRTSLGLLQRIRGQVLALAAGYVGLIGAIQGIGAVIDTIRTLEAAQNRLGGVFQQNTEKVTAEMRFLAFQADRLGISFAVLSDQYTQFAVAANQANFSADATRKIFLSVAEAGRVNKLSTEDLTGVFLALQQMISKGTVQSEELRKQMGNRLPGAFNIFAQSLGVTTEELGNMLKAGDVLANESTLLKFAKGLDKAFSEQLPTALTSVTTSLGRFSNDLFNVTKTIATGGFAEGLKKLLDQLDVFFKSKDGQDFFLSIGAALKSLLGGLTFLVQHTELLAAAFKLLIAFKVTQFFSSLLIEITKLTPAFRALATEEQTAGAANKIFAGGLVTMVGGLKSFGGTLATVPGRLVAATTSLTAMRGAMTSLAIGGIGVLRTALSSLGALLASIPQLLIAMAVAFAVMKFVEWTSQVNDATDAMADHERVMQLVMKAQEAMKDKTNALRESLKSLTLIELRKHFLDLLQVIFDSKKAFDDLDTTLAQGLNLSRADEETNQLKTLAAQFQQNKLSAQEFLDQLGKLAQNMVTPEAVTLAAQYEALAQKLIEVKAAANETVKAGSDLGDDLTKLIPITGQAAQGVAAIGDASKTSAAGIDTAAASTQTLADKNTALVQSQASIGAGADTAFGRMTAAIDGAIAGVSGLWDVLTNGASAAWDSIVNAASSGIASIKTFIDDLIAAMDSLWEAAKRALGMAQSAKAAAPAPGHASGGPIHGPGTGTSDSIPAWLSTGEWVIKAEAVKKYGAAIFALLNSMKIPPTALRNMLQGFAMGGPVSFNLGPMLAGAFADGGPIVSDRVALDLSLGGEHIGTVMSPRDVADKLIKFALNEQIKSGGRKPSWYR